MPAVKDITGQRFGRLTVIERAPTPPFYAQTEAWWLCKCDCGKTTTAAGRTLRVGKKKSCGCLRSELAVLDLTGQRFGRLVVLERAKPPKPCSYRHRAWWLCKCDCGTLTTVRSCALRTGNTKSCGCLWREQAHIKIERKDK